MTWRVDISERPAIADQKTEIGHWESDRMIGGNHLGVLVTASEINRVTEKLFQEIHPDKRKTFTCDNGKEFCGHQESREETRSRFLFCYSLSFVGKGIKRAYQWTVKTIFPQGNEF